MALRVARKPRFTLFAMALRVARKPLATALRVARKPLVMRRGCAPRIRRIRKVGDVGAHCWFSTRPPGPCTGGATAGLGACAALLAAFIKDE